MSNQTIDPMQPTPYRIHAYRLETHDTFSLELVPQNGTIQDPFLPGQFNMLYVFGVGEVPISISGDPDKKNKLTHTVRAVGTVTNVMKDLKRGNTLGVRGPFGTVWPVEQGQGKDIVIVAGGIGLAPLRPVIYHLLSNREKYGRLILLYGTRSPEDILYSQELEKWRSRFDLDVHITVDRASGSWKGNIGVVTTLIPRTQMDPANTLAMICGPEVMMRFTVAELQKRGLSEPQIYISMERNMKCAVGFCGHCQYGPTFICKDGPVFRYDQIQHLLGKREV